MSPSPSRMVIPGFSLSLKVRLLCALQSYILKSGGILPNWPRILAKVSPALLQTSLLNAVMFLGLKSMITTYSMLFLNMLSLKSFEVAKCTEIIGSPTDAVGICRTRYIH